MPAIMHDSWRLPMNNAVEIGEKGVTVHLAGGGRVVVGNWSNDTSTAANL